MSPKTKFFLLAVMVAIILAVVLDLIGLQLRFGIYSFYIVVLIITVLIIVLSSMVAGRFKGRLTIPGWRRRRDSQTQSFFALESREQ